MDSQFSRRRPHGFVGDTPEQGPDQGSLTSPYQSNFTYSPAPPQSSTFSYPTTTNHISFASEGQVLATSSFHGVPPQDPADYNQQYQQQHQAFCEQPPFYSQHHTQSDTQQQSYYQSPTSRKRQRRDSEMRLPFFPRPSASHGDQEKVAGPGIEGENAHHPGSTMFQQLESFCCPPWSDYSTATAYASIPSSSMYGGSTVPAYSTNLESPSHHQLSQNQVIVSSGAEPPSIFLFSANSQANQQLQEKFPPLEPVPYLSTLPPAAQEPMSYQSINSQQDDSRSEASPAFIKSELREQKYQPVDYQTGPNTALNVSTDYTATGISDNKHSPYHTHDLVRYSVLQQEPVDYRSFSSQQDNPRSATSSAFAKPEVLEYQYQPVDYRAGPSSSFSVATEYTAAGIPESNASPYHTHDLALIPVPQRYPISHSYGPQETVHTEHAGFFQLGPHGNRLDVVLSNQKPQATKRGPFKDPKKRAKTAQVRKIGSCIRCRMQRIRCEFDPDSPDDENAPCDGCKKIIANSKIHRMPCRRWKLTDIRLSKPGQVDEPDLKWTHRWQDSATLPEITHWASTEIRNIRLTDGYGKAITVKVRRFKELPSDKKDRFIRHDDGTEETIPTEPFGLVDVEAVKMEYERYLKSGRAQICKALCGPREKLLWKTYQLAWERRDNPRIPLDERDLLSRTLDLWVAVRLTTKSFEITGNETLGIPPDKSGKVVLPPVMGAQLDKIIIDHILPKLRRETLETLQAMTQQKKSKAWMTTYLVTFMLLHNVALITRHDKHYAQKHKMKEKFGKEWARAKMVRQYHLGANILLAYFHYCNKGLYPFSQECKESDLQTLAELDEDSLDFVKRTRIYVEDYKRDWEYLRQSTNPDDYGDDYYFISQLFEHNWLPRDTTVIG